jgi:hypothetical protein
LVVPRSIPMILLIVPNPPLAGDSQPRYLVCGQYMD